VVFNYLDIEELIRHIENINWEDQHQFSFLLKERKKAFSQAMWLLTKVGMIVNKN